MSMRKQVAVFFKRFELSKQRLDVVPVFCQRSFRLE